MHFGATLRLLRIDAGWSLQELARRVGVSTAYLSRVENGHDAPPTSERLTEIAQAFGLRPELLSELAHRLDPSVAAYLEATPAVIGVLREVSSRKLTAVDLGRVRSFVRSEFPAKREAHATDPRLSALLSPDRIIANLTCSGLEDVIDVAATRLATAIGEGRGHGPALAAEILRREQEAPTLLGAGVAVPHARTRASNTAAVVASLARPLAARSPDGEPLSLVIVLASNLKPKPHLELLAHVARLANDGVVSRLRGAHDPRRLLAELEAFEAAYE